MSNKTNKSFTKRLRVTKNGKVLAKKEGFNHFNMKTSGQKQSASRRAKPFKIKAKDKNRFMPHE